jgi:hypothetical protein
MDTRNDDLSNARQHLRLAFAAAEERILGKDVVGHLRQAARHVLKAGISRIDEMEEHRTGKPSGT